MSGCQQCDGHCFQPEVCGHGYNPQAIEADGFDNWETGFERPCPMCSGTGQREYQDCWLCDGEGYL